MTRERFRGTSPSLLFLLIDAVSERALRIISHLLSASFI